MTPLFTWIGMLHPILQAIVVVLAFLVVVGLILFVVTGIFGWLCRRA